MATSATGVEKSRSETTETKSPTAWAPKAKPYHGRSTLYTVIRSEPVVPTGGPPPWPRQRQVSKNRDLRVTADWATGQQNMKPKTQLPAGMPGPKWLASEPVVPTGGPPPWPRQQQVTENRDPKPLKPKAQLPGPKGLNHITDMLLYIID